MTDTSPQQLPRDHAVEFTLELMSVFEHVLQIEDVDAGRPLFVADRVNAITLQRLVGAVDETYRSSRFAKAIDCLAPMPTHHIQSTGIGFTSDFDLFVKLGFLFADRVVLWNALIDSMLFSGRVDVEELGLQVCHFLEFRPIAEENGLVLLPHPSLWLQRYQYYLRSIARIKNLGNDFAGLLNARALLDEGFALHPYATPESPLYGAMHSTLIGVEDKFLPEKLAYQSASARLLGEQRLELLATSGVVPFFRAITDISREVRSDLRQRLSAPPGLSMPERAEHLDGVVRELEGIVTRHNLAVKKHGIVTRSKAIGLAAAVPGAIGATIAVLAGEAGLSAILGMVSTALAAPYVAAWEVLEKLGSRPEETVLFKLFRNLGDEQASYDDAMTAAAERQEPFTDAASASAAG